MKTKLNKTIGVWSYLATLGAVHFVFVILQTTDVFQIDLRQMLVVQSASLLLLLLSTGILFVKKTADVTSLTFRLLVLSVTQLLGYLSACLALIYSDQPNELVLYLLGLSLCVLIMQTSYLVRRLK
mgnify:CR=1 FL=1|jgi:hypothetical protein